MNMRLSGKSLIATSDVFNIERVIILGFVIEGALIPIGAAKAIELPLKATS